MADPKWTPAQQAAIDYRGSGLLLSAAAGSGKTATLTQRIVRLLTDPESDAQISRMLCVTFTRAAAAELRERIGRALRKALAADPQNRHLTAQICDLGRAQITTIHSFCLRILRPHAAELGLPAGFSVAQPADVAGLSRQVMADVLSARFDGGDEAFFRLADTLGGARDEGSLDAVMLELAGTLSSCGMSAEDLYALADQMEETHSFFNSPLGAGTRAQTLRFARHYQAYFSAVIDDFSDDPALAKAYVPMASAYTALANELVCACEAGDYTAARQALAAFSPPARIGTIRGQDPSDDVELFKAEHKQFRETVKKLHARSFTMTEEEILLSAARTADICRSAAAVLQEYFQELDCRKKERGIVDYGDLESKAAALLTNADGTPTEIAREAGKAFDYIFIDEYQDTNRAQDAIFAALAEGGGARFMVGDIKQSIYRFRGAEPAVFADYRRRWPSVEEQGEGDGRSLFMRENFRCDRTVVDFVNLVSRHIFSSGSIEFTPEDELAFAKKVPPEYTGTPVRICLLDAVPGGDKKQQEAEYIADCIADMIGRTRLADGSLVKAGQIAILLRSANVDGAPFAEALSRRGIRSCTQTARSLYGEPEVLLMLSILRSIDNPTRDIDLAGAMKSPVFGFSLDDLIAIRNLDPAGSLWDAVRLCAAQEDSLDLSQRCAAFVQRLSALRKDSRGTPSDKLLLRLYDETDVIRLAEEDPERAGAAVRENLRTLYDTARQYENRTGGGLYGFLRFIQDAIEKQEGETTETPAEDAVQILSIHHSKGLEYPVCFLARAAKEHNRKNSARSLLFDPLVGAVMRLPDEDGLVLCDTPLRRSAAAIIDDADTEEEMRVLYVALTRARERLIVTAAVKDAEQLLQNSRRAALFHTDYSVYAAPHFLAWILNALAAAERQGIDTGCVSVQVIAAPQEEEEAGSVSTLSGNASEETSASPLDTAEIAQWETLFRERFSFMYPHTHLSGIPAKLTVSRLSPSILDETAEETRTALSREPLSVCSSERNRAPRFLSGKTEAEASFAGTATHVFMQFCDFERLAQTDACTELQRLHTAGFLTDAMAKAVRLEEIERFRHSELFARIRRAPTVRREFRFNASLPAADLTRDAALSNKLRTDGTDVIVQGVVDCLMIEADGRTVLLDYKTDRLTQRERTDPALAAQKLRARHGEQLRYYRIVCASMLGRPIDECLLYSLHLGDCISIPDEEVSL